MPNWILSLTPTFRWESPKGLCPKAQGWYSNPGGWQERPGGCGARERALAFAPGAGFPRRRGQRLGLTGCGLAASAQVPGAHGSPAVNDRSVAGKAG